MGYTPLESRLRRYKREHFCMADKRCGAEVADGINTRLCTGAARWEVEDFIKYRDGFIEAVELFLCDDCLHALQIFKVGEDEDTQPTVRLIEGLPVVEKREPLG